MRKTFTRVLLLLGGFLLVAFVVVLVNQTAQLVGLAARASPALGEAVFWGLIFLYGACIGVPAFMLLRLPKPLTPPRPEHSDAFDAHIERLGQRLAANPHLDDRTYDSKAEVEAALAILDERADDITKKTASQVFLTTAISQNGALDTIVVLAAQSKMVLRVARTYYQRPTLRDLIYLYANVATTSFVAGELEDMDLAAQVQPVISSVLGSAAGAVPGLQAASALIVNSVTTGSANAFLLLRTGAIAKRYCGALVAQPKRVIRRSATLEATQLLGSIVITGARTVTRAVVKGSATALGGSIKGVGGSIKDLGTGVWDRMRPGDAGASESPEPDAPGG